MDYNVQFQTSALVFIFVIIGIYLFKPKAKDKQNKIFFAQLVLSEVLVLVDIISCYFIAEKDSGPAIFIPLNEIFGKLYIILMILWLSMLMYYLTVTIRHDKMSYRYNQGLDIYQKLIFVIAGILIVVTLCFSVEFYHSGRIVYSYGFPSICTYAFSALISFVIFFLLFSNWKYLTPRKKIPCLAFVVAGGIPALIQALNPELLLLSLGIAITELIIYMALENPDLEYAKRIEILNREKNDLYQIIVPEPFAVPLNYQIKPMFTMVENVCVGVIRINNFNEITSLKGLEPTLKMISKIYQAIDSVLDNYGIEKVKMDSESYVVAIGFSERNETDCQNMISFMNSVRSIISGLSLGNGIEIKTSYGVDYGSVCAAVMGTKRVHFDIISKTADLANRLTLECDADKILVTDAVKKQTETVFEYIRTMTKIYPDYGIEHLFYLKEI